MKALEGLNWAATVEPRKSRASGLVYHSAVLVERDPREVGDSKTMFYIEGHGNQAQERLRALMIAGASHEKLVSLVRSYLSTADDTVGGAIQSQMEIDARARDLLRELGELP